MIQSKKSGCDYFAWWIVAAAAAGGVALLAWRYPDIYRPLLRSILPSYREVEGVRTFHAGALLETLRITLTALLLSLSVGVVIGLLRTVRNVLVRLPAALYVEFIRGIPLLVILFVTYYGLNREWVFFADTSREFRLPSVGPFWAATLGLVVCYAAFISEIIRAGIEAIPREQLEAAFLEGNHLQVARHVILPQAVRNTLPAVGNEFIALLKDSSLISILAINELTLAAKNYAGATFLYFESYFLVALIYLMVTLFLSHAFHLLERWWDVSG